MAWSKEPSVWAEVAHPVYLMGMTTQPESTYAETMREAMARLGKELDGSLRYDSEARVLTLMPAYSPLDTVASELGGASVPAGASAVPGLNGWAQIKDASSQKSTVAMTGWTTNTGEYSCNLKSLEAQQGIQDGQGLWVTIRRSAPHKDAVRASDGVYTSFILSESPGFYTQVCCDYGRSPYVMHTVDSWLTEVSLGDIPVGDSGVTGDNTCITFLILNIGGQTIIRAGQSGLWNDAGLDLGNRVFDGNITFRAKGVNASIAAFPVTWVTSGTVTSGLKEKQWPTASTAVFRVDGSPDLSGSRAQIPAGVVASDIKQASPYWSKYRLTLTRQHATAGGNQVYWTPWVSQISVRYPAISIAPKTGNTWRTLDAPMQFSAVKQFNKNELSVSSECELTFRNRNNSAWNMSLQDYAPWGASSGMRALRVFSQYRSSDPWLRFSGWCGHQAEGDCQTFRLRGADRSYPLRRAMMYNPPFFDGMCIYHAIKILAQRAGVHVSSLAIGLGNPADAWGCDGFTCDEATGHIKMRRGTGANPLMKFPDGTTVWSAMQEIRRLYGFALLFDATGMLRFTPWNPWNARNDWNPVQWFSATPVLNKSGYPQLNEFLDNVTVSRSLEDTRNSVTLVGLNRDTYEPTVVHHRDDTSIFGYADAFGDSMPANFKGFIDSYVESSAMFIDKDFMSRFAALLFNIMRQPRETHELCVWGQNLNPLDYVAIDAHRMMTDRPYDKFYIDSVREDANAWDNSYMMKVNCELIPYALTDSTPFSGPASVQQPVPLQAFHRAHVSVMGTGANGAATPYMSFGSGSIENMALVH